MLTLSGSRALSDFLFKYRVRSRRFLFLKKKRERIEVDLPMSVDFPFRDAISYLFYLMLAIASCFVQSMISLLFRYSWCSFTISVKLLFQSACPLGGLFRHALSELVCVAGESFGAADYYL